MKFNINDKVKVRLTDYGRECIRRNTNELNKFIEARGGKPLEHHLPKEDEGGWSEWHLWCLMKDLGPYISLGGEAPFETTIKIPS